MFSATYDDDVVGLVEQFLRQDHVKLTVTNPPNINQHVYWIKESEKYDWLKLVLSNSITNNSKIVVFANKRATCDALQTNLTNDGYHCLAFHNNVGGPATRKETMAKFLKGEIRLLIATDILGRGVDIKDITHVINYDAPESFQNYIHRVGRTGRAGKEGLAMTFVNKKTKIIKNLFEAANENKNIKLPQELIDYVMKGQGKTEEISQEASGSQYGYGQDQGYQTYYGNVESDIPEIGQSFPYQEDEGASHHYFH
uniref:Helicase C-terminal domain-containing protein n=1 Tax=Meloidogyne incognita TaxID=6306 RepID=A0A914KX87_MELIC